MMVRSFDLKAFAGQSQTQVQVLVEMDSSTISIRYVLKCAFDNLVWPKLSTAPEFKDGLWRSTCLEIFLAKAGDPAYLEWNFSPNSDWACYEFTDYRQGQSPIKLHKPEVFSFQEGAVKVLTAKIPRPSHAELEIQISAILDQGGENSYWSLQHASEKPDFHWRAGFQSLV